MGRLCRRAWDDEDKIRKDKRSKSRRNKHEINGKVKTGESEIKGGKTATTADDSKRNHFQKLKHVSLLLCY